MMMAPPTFVNPYAAPPGFAAPRMDSPFPTPPQPVRQAQPVPNPAPAQAQAPVPSWTAAPVPPSSAPRPIIRAQAPDDVPPTPRQALALPSPEALGLLQAPAAAVDWADVHARLNRLGATCFHLERVARGGCRITCLLPTGEVGRIRRVEAQAESEAEAVRLTLAKAEEYTAAR